MATALHDVVCPMCKTAFSSVRSDARFCSVNCRVNHHKALKRVNASELLYGVPHIFDRAIHEIHGKAPDSWAAIRMMSEQGHNIKSVKMAIIVSFLAVCQLAGDDTTNSLYVYRLMLEMNLLGQWFES